MKTTLRFMVAAVLASLFLCGGILLAAGTYKHPSEQTMQLCEAAWHGDLEKVKSLIAQGADVNAENQGDYTPLYYAVMENRDDVAAFLIASGAKINARI